MLQVRRDPDLGEEPLGAQHGAQLGIEHLERDVAIVLQVLREVDGGHAAGADLALDPVAVSESGGQALQRVGQHCACAVVRISLTKRSSLMIAAR